MIQLLKVESRRRVSNNFGLNFHDIIDKYSDQIQGVVTVKLTGIKCNNTLSKTVVNTTCNLKSYSRTNTVLNFESYVIRYVNSSKAKVSLQLTFKSYKYLSKILFALKLRLTIYYRVRTKYQQFLDHTVDDFCGILAGGKNAFMDRLFLDPVRLAAPDMFHPCPYVIYEQEASVDYIHFFIILNYSMDILELKTSP